MLERKQITLEQRLTLFKILQFELKAALAAKTFDQLAQKASDYRDKLRELYSTLPEGELKEKTLFALATCTVLRNLLFRPTLDQSAIDGAARAFEQSLEKLYESAKDSSAQNQ